MFVYQGKMNWWTYAKDETFVVVLPNGPVRVGDSVYLFWKWTVDAKGVKNGNVFQTISVDSVTQTSATDVTFVLKGSWYSFTVTTKGGYENISIVMRNPQGGVSDPMPLKREWQSDKELTGTTRIWTGKFKWMNFAQDEHAIFIVPDGFGEGKPILSTWQWTKASSGKTKVPSFRAEVQRNVTGLGTDTVEFSYKSYYDIKCTWDGKKDQLDVWITEGAHSEDVGDMVRSAIIERQSHSHDLNPPDTTLTKGECELRLPQAQASLPRLLCPLPFPKGLLETLAHTAAFVDQCGYLAKYAQDHFIALDADYHKALELINSLKAEIVNLTKTRDDLIVDRDGSRSKVKNLQDALDKALKDIEQLQKEVARLQECIADDALKDAEAAKLLQKTQQELKTEQGKVAGLTKEKAELKAENDKCQATILGLQAQIITLETTIANLKAELTVKITENKNLTDKNIQLESDNGKLEGTVKDLRRELEAALARIADLEADGTKQDNRIRELIDEKSKALSNASVADQRAATAESTVAKYKKWAFKNKVVIDLSTV
ncbi:hypothetical protein FOYG_12054 [Fusarium oxysporum NRRL 32931]|uniref:Uncharacterized protein n=1 Tax=Fusarium oxysporum NRRL 32931 TaxID=660029 RepID=W9HUX7_FUSOX|nr:hypothetical protein FOYG_12054 [Fusarium oxysporum NRRL 32931]